MQSLIDAINKLLAIIVAGGAYVAVATPLPAEDSSGSGSGTQDDLVGSGTVIVDVPDEGDYPVVSNPDNPDDPAYVPGVADDLVGDVVYDPQGPGDPGYPNPPVVYPGNGDPPPGVIPPIQVSPPTTMPSMPASPGSIALTAGGASIHFQGGDKKAFQSVLDALKPGDTLYIANSVKIAGQFTLRPQPDGAGRIVIRAEQIPTGRPTRTAQLPTFVNESSPQRAIFQSKGANGYSLIGLKLWAEKGFMYYGLEIGSVDQTKLSDAPNNFTLYRCLILGNSSRGMRVGIGLHGKAVDVIENYMADLWDPNSSDSQAIQGGAGPGPYWIEGNYLSSATENIIFGGFGPKIANMVARDIVITGNEIEKPLAWHGHQNGMSCKNLFETKCVENLWLIGNKIHGSWVGQQGGEGLVLTARGQGNKAPWARVANLYVAGNHIWDVGAGVNILGRDYSSGYVPYFRNVTIEHNLIEVTSSWGRGFGFQILTGAEDLTIRRNTVIGCKQGIFMECDKLNGGKPGDSGFKPRYPNLRVKVNANVIQGAVVGTGVSQGQQAFSVWTKDSDFGGNIVLGGAWPAGNTQSSQGSVLNADKSVKPAYAGHGADMNRVA